MKYYEQLLDKRIFTYNDIIEIAGNRNAAKSVIYEYKRRGHIKSIKRNLYTVVSLETKQPVANKFEIGSNITDSSYISHHSAFSYYGLTNQVFYELYISSDTRFNDFEFEGITYKFVQSKFDNGTVRPNTNPLINITDLERTVIDSIKDFEKIAGLEELLYCLGMITYLDNEKLKKYLQLYDLNYLYQKTGYLLEYFKENMKLPNSFFRSCQKNIGKSIRYFLKNQGKDEGVFDKRWQLVVPENLISITGQGGEEPV